MNFENFESEDGVSQRRYNPGFTLGAYVTVTPDDTDSVVYDLECSFKANIIGYQGFDLVEVESVKSKKSYYFYMDQLELVNA